MKPIDHAKVLITGASKGIGLAIAKEFANHGHDLILVARSDEALETAAARITEMSGVRITTYALDLTEERTPEWLYERLDRAGHSVDILVNNAGVGMTGSFAGSDPAQIAKMLRLNVLALTQLTHLFLQPMLERRRGRVLNVGSVAAYFSGGPNWSAYVASKHYVHAFSRGLSRELRGSGVAATLLSPGATPTDFVKRADAEEMLVYRAPGGPSVEDIARLAYAACQKGAVSVVPGLFNKILAFLGELHPRFIAFRVFALLSQKRGTDLPKSGQVTGS